MIKLIGFLLLASTTIIGYAYSTYFVSTTLNIDTDDDVNEDFKNQLKHAISEEISSVRLRRAATARLERLWDYGVIPYEIESNFSGM